MPRCEVEPGVELYYETFGDGPPVAFVHGGGASHEMWEQQVFELADRYRTVALDLRGHGDSDKPAHGHTIGRFTRDVEALLGTLGIGTRAAPVALVCHAIGGYVGIRYALDNPGAVSRLVLVNSSARFLGADPERGGFSIELWERLMTGMGESKIEANRRLVEETFFHRDPGEATRRATLATMLKWPVYATKLLGRDLVTIDFEDRLPEIDTPALVIHGRHDRKQRFSGAQHLAALFPQGRLEVFEDSAHNPQLEERERFNALLESFLSEAAGATPVAATG